MIDGVHILLTLSNFQFTSKLFLRKNDDFHEKKFEIENPSFNFFTAQIELHES